MSTPPQEGAVDVKLAPEQSHGKAAYVSAHFRKLLLWEQPLHSFIALISIVGTNYAVANYNPLRVASAFVFCAIAAHLVFVNTWVIFGALFVDVKKDGGLRKPPTMWFLEHHNRNPLPHGLVQEYAVLLTDICNFVFSLLASLIACDSTRVSVRALFGSAALFTLTKWLSTGTIIYIATVLGFLVPRLYLANQQVTDEYIAQLTTIINHHASKIESMAVDYFNIAKGQVMGLMPARVKKE